MSLYKELISFDVSHARAELKMYLDEEIHELRLEHEDCLKEASNCRILALEAAEDGDRKEAVYMKEETNRYMSGTEGSLKRMMKMQKMREQLFG